MKSVEDRIVKGRPDECWRWSGSHRPNGYARYCGNGKWRSVTRYLQNPMPGQVVRHTCDNPWCCNPKHLICGSVQDNVRDRVERGRCASGERNGNAKLIATQVDEIRRLYQGPYVRGEYTQVKLAKMFGVSQRMISLIVRGEFWT